MTGESRTQHWLTLALEAAHMVAWTATLPDRRITYSEGATRFFGPGWGAPADSWAHTDAQDAARLQAAIDAAIERRDEYCETVRYRAPGQPMRWLEVRGCVQCDADGRPVAMHGVTWDVTAHRLAEQAARVNEENFSRVFASSPDALCITRRDDGRMLEVNEGFLALYGARREDVIGRSTLEIGLFLDPQDRAAVVAQVLAHGSAREVRMKVRRLDGQVRDVVASTVAIALGDEPCLLVSQRDVTDVLRTQEALQESERRLQLALSGAEMGFWQADYVRGEVAWDAQHIALHGLPADHPRVVPPGRWGDMTHPDDRARVHAEIAAARREGRGYHVETRIRRADTGEERWMSAYGRFFNAPDGTPERGIGFAFDITARKRAEQELRRSEAEFRGLFELSGAGVAQVDPATSRFVRVNRRFCEITGRTAGELLALTPLDLTHPDDRELDRARTGPILSGDADAWESEKRYVRGDGSIVWVHVVGRLLRGPDGLPFRTIASIVDVTDRKRAEEELRIADRRKDEFLATLAHELRNPLAPIRYSARLLRGDAPASVLLEAREMIERQTGHMARLLDDLLDMSRVTRNVIELRRDTLDFRRTVEQVLAAARPLVESAQHRLVVSLPGDPLWVSGDPTRLAQIVDNLVQNAIKYTDHGGRLEVELSASDGNARLRVTDTGIGIPPGSVADVFELFAQVHRGPDGHRTGLGIGLAVVRRLVGLHGGTISAASDGPGRGSTFTVSLPLAAPPAGRADGADIVALYGERPRVLLVDDHEDIIASLAALLRLEGYPVHTAPDGATALALAESVRPDVVVLDLGMPGMTGYDVARAIRRQPWGARLRLIAATGWGQDEDRRRTREAGFDAHLTKPVDPDELLRLLVAVPPSAARHATPGG